MAPFSSRREGPASFNQVEWMDRPENGLYRRLRAFLSILFRLTLWLQLAGLIFLAANYFLLYWYIWRCSWPTVVEQASDNVTRVMLFSDTHLVGLFRGHPLDRLIRDFEMKRAFHLAVTIHQPQAIIFLGDILDEGYIASRSAFRSYVKRYRNTFTASGSQLIAIKNIPGNHDVGFHYQVDDYALYRFHTEFGNNPSMTPVRLWTISNNLHFVLLNSMAFHGDECDLCQTAETAVEAIASHLNELKTKGKIKNNRLVDWFMEPDSQDPSSTSYARPILLQHFPLYRLNELKCSDDEPDAMPADKRSDGFLERKDCLSREASQSLLAKLNPRLVLNGHVHYACNLQHDIPVHNTTADEWTSASFSYRNLENPSFLSPSSDHYHKTDDKPKRDAWMTELLPVSRQTALVNRKFKTGSSVSLGKSAADAIDNSWFTTGSDDPSTTGDQETQKPGSSFDPSSELYDNRMDQVVASLQSDSRITSLLDQHNEKRRDCHHEGKKKKKAKSDKNESGSKHKKKDRKDKKKKHKDKKKKQERRSPSPTVRRPFDRDNDLKISRLDAGARHSLIQRSKQFTSRFGPGSNRYL